MWAPWIVLNASFSRHDPLSKGIEELWVVCAGFIDRKVYVVCCTPADTAPQFLWKLTPSTKI